MNAMHTLKAIKAIACQKDPLKNFKKDFEIFNSLDENKKLKNDWKEIHPCLGDNTRDTGFDGHYIYHPAWAARIIKRLNPSKHVDISSTLHFCSILSAFIPVDFYDYRPANLNLDNLHSGKEDLTALSFHTSSIESISCMHTIEHIGLGRYGDPLDPEGDIKAINELKRVVKVGGSVLFVTPIGIPRIMFNAHRIYSTSMILNFFEGFILQNFSLVNDSQEFISNADLEEGNKQQYGCGCFWFKKASE